MAKDLPPERGATTYSPEFMTGLCTQRSLWHETEAEIEAGLQWGRRKAALLNWIRAQMALRLTERERQCMEMHFFDNLTYREIGRRTGTNASSVCRAVQRGIRRVRAATVEDSSWRQATIRRRRFTAAASTPRVETESWNALPGG